MWIAAVFYFIAAAYLFQRIRKQRVVDLYPITTYLSGISAFFFFMGLSIIVDASVIPLLAALAVMLGASTIAKFPLRMQWPHKEKQIYYLLLAVSVAVGGYTFYFRPEIMIRAAHLFAFLVAGLFTMGYIIYYGLKSKNKIVKTKSISTGTSLGLCCVIAHGLAFSQLLPLIALPLFGFTLKAPMIFAMLSPIAFILVLILSKYIKEESTITKLNKKPIKEKTKISNLKKPLLQKPAKTKPPK
jgi:hypothetical protein